MRYRTLRLGVYLIGLGCLTGCMGPRAFLDLKAQCKQLGEKVVSESACDDNENMQGLQATCKDFVDEAEEYDCGSPAKSIVDCLMDTDAADLCAGESMWELCPSETDSFMECMT